ncbi:MAG: 3-oxoadipate enol-lactonase [Acidobacteriaceae bacterium]|nr:3-oxoadipate enol-lactonase [Acidobacteriaceae bacterium]
MPFADIGRTTAHYELHGPADGALLVLSHSLGSDLSMWDPQVPVFSNRFRVLRYDTRGHGRSSVPSGPYTIEQLTQDVVDLLDFLGERQAYFCGLSMGGMVGMQLAHDHPERLRALVLASTAPRIGSIETWNARIDTVRQNGMQALSQSIIERWFTLAFRLRHPEIIAKIERSILNTPPEGYAACCAVLRDTDLRPLLPALRVPTLVISATHDPATPPADGQSLSTQIPGARYIELPAAHLSNVESAAAFNDEVDRFFTP